MATRADAAENREEKERLTALANVRLSRTSRFVQSAAHQVEEGDGVGQNSPWHRGSPAETEGDPSGLQ